MTKSFEEACSELKEETMERLRALDEEKPLKNTLDGPQTLKRREIHREFARKLVELRKEYGKE
ncbi:hypothetical protein [Gracilibacillus alcaliphilus]|uniref:hypothetical protein n=1 Tax=Gracilibacillus alcaliphilus TaxID=1401441 RepID=UPI00195A6339|nr:hypothetical protein [Gracilibacillus alcaliphilus]MBM7678962.1 hypothetical protein [Gracilibacillus alcaliphilus]